MATGPELTPELLTQLERTALHFTAAGGFDDDIQVAEVLASIPALVAAAKERDQLQIAALDAMFDRDQLSEMLGTSQIDRANLGDQVDQLRAEVERLRELGLEATKVLDRAGIVTNLCAEIERKP